MDLSIKFTEEGNAFYAWRKSNRTIDDVKIKLVNFKLCDNSTIIFYRLIREGLLVSIIIIVQNIINNLYNFLFSTV